MNRTVLLLASALSLQLAADERPSQTERDIEKANTLTLDAFARMQCSLAGVEPVALKPTKDSRLRWSNPVVGRVYGNVFLWTDDAGRPAAAVSIYKAYSPWNSLDIECSSLSKSPLLMTYDGRTIWTPPPSALEWKQLPSAPGPAPNEKTRLIQMRALVRRFKANVADKRLTEDVQVSRDLRPLMQPMYRYASPEHRIVDAGMFAFTVGTDPEAFLILECRADENDRKAWYFALARMNRDGLEVRLDRKVVWSADFIPTDRMGQSNSPYRSAPAPAQE